MKMEPDGGMVYVLAYRELSTVVPSCNLKFGHEGSLVRP